VTKQHFQEIMPSLSPAILSILAPFALLFSRPVWKKALTLLIGTLLCRGKRTVCAALRVMGLSNEPNFSKYHHVLNRVEWSLLSAAHILLNLIVDMAGSGNPLVFFIDETLERRKGPKIKAKGYYRDAVRSSKKIVVKTSGLKWLTLAVSLRFPFSERHFALPFMTVLEPSAKSDKAAKKRHKTTLQWTIQMLIQIVRWLKNTPIILVGDGGFACGALAWRCLKLKITLITRLKMNARLYDFAPVDEPGKRGRKKMKGTRLFSFKEMVGMPDLGWTEIVIEGYGQKKKRLKYISNVNLWGADGFLPIPIKWVLVIDPEGELDPVPLMSTDIMISAEKIILLYVRRWNIEVTFEEVREHLGVETQRQWSDKAIARTTPVLMGLYTIVCLICNRLQEERPIEVAQTAWYEKKDATFSDLLKTVRKILWKDNLIFRKHIFESFQENNKGLDEVFNECDKISPESTWIRVLIEHLAAA
jgi:DDE superfamily endonuclease